MDMTSRGHDNKADADIELSDVGLLERNENGGGSHSWYSAHGRGFSLDGRQTETRGGTSHVGTVLGEGFYSRERRNQQIWEVITEKPFKAFNVSSVALAIVVFILALVLAGRSSNQGSATATQESTFAPEGALDVNIAQSYDYRGKPRRIVSTTQSVAADHGRCSDIGLEVLVNGGNAVDSMVATALCQGVMNPVASGIGGGAFIVVRLPNGTSAVIDAREIAPAAASETMFAGNETASLEGGLAIAVPLELKGLWAAHQRFGNVSWHILVEPTAALARKGFPAHPYLVDKITKYQDSFQANPQLQRVFLVQDGKRWRVPKINETCCIRLQLAELLDDIALSGPDALYTTKKVEGLAADIQEAGGIITADDLRNAQPVLKDPLQSEVYGVEILAPPPPSSAAVIVAALHILQGYAKQLPFAGPGASHWLVEAMKSAFALRTHLGDPGNCTTEATCFLDLDAVLNDTLSLEFADSLRAGLEDSSAQPTPQYGGIWKANTTSVEDHGTSHLSVVDKHRMAASMTTSINTAFGSLVYSKSTGILLNNEMDDFSTPGQANTYGLVPSPANFIRPGKKPLSSMSPIILADGSGLRAVVGAGGGPRIITSVLSSIYRMVALGQDPMLAVSSARLHHQLLPDHAFAESWSTAASNFTVAEDVTAALRKRGNEVVATDWGAVCQAIVVNPENGVLTSVSDPRKDGAPAGV